MPNVLTVLALLPEMAPNPVDEGSLRPGLDPSQVTPGMLGFLMSLLLAAAVILLVLDFNRRNRRLRYRAEYAERRAAEERVGGYADRSAAPDRPAAAQEPGAPEGSGPTDSPGPDASPATAAEEPAPPADGGSARRG